MAYNHNEYMKNWYKKHPDYAAKMQRKHHDPVRKALWAYSFKLRKYGITLDIYKEMCKKLKGKCQVCRQIPKDKYNRLVVDHCHKKNKFRGLLCRQCNSAFGLLGESPKRVLALWKYVSKSSWTSSSKN